MFGRKKYSPKVKAQSQLWLEQNGSSLDRLTEQQQEELFKLTKIKRYFTWAVPFSLIMFVVYIGLMIYGCKLVSEIKIDFAPEHYVIEGDNGEEQIKDIPIEIQDSFKTYGNVLVIFGLFLGGIVYSGINVIISPIVSHFTYRKQKRTILAFLPLT